MERRVVYETAIGPLEIRCTDTAITYLKFAPGSSLDSSESTELSDKAISQVNAYLAGKRTTFDLPLEMRGTAFQKQVWQALCKIPYGKTVSYKEIAEAIGNPKAVRAVGMANNRNPIVIVVPCHRVIGNNGKLVGYAGGVALKATLLKLESDK